MAQWLVITVCPINQRDVHVVISAPNQPEAEKKARGMTIVCPYPMTDHTHESHKFKIEKIKAVMPYPWEPPAVKTIRGIGVLSGHMTVPKLPTERKAPTMLLSSKRIDDTVTVAVTRGQERLDVIFPQPEIRQFDNLMKFAVRLQQASLRNAIIAYLIVHLAGTKTVITGFLQAEGFSEATPSTIGEAMSRLRDEGIIFSESAIFTFKYYPLTEFGQIEKVRTSQIMGEAVYGISHRKSIEILERLKFEPHLQWWNMLTQSPILQVVKKPVQYEWVQLQQTTPRFRAAEDLHYYGPYKPRQTVKLPLGFAYFLTRLGVANWLNPKKEDVANVENLFKLDNIEKVRRQTTLGSF